MKVYVKKEIYGSRKQCTRLTGKLKYTSLKKTKKKKKEPKRKEIINIQTYNKPANSTQLTLVKVLAIVEV